MKKIIIPIVVILLATTSVSIVAADDDSPYISRETVSVDGVQLERIVINGPPTPPSGLTRTVVNLDKAQQGAAANLDVPHSTWSFGCSATSAAMIAGYYDQHGYNNMYTGLANGGFYPDTNAEWGSWTDGCADSIALNPLSATKNGLDGRTSNGGVDDYWECIGYPEDPAPPDYHDPWYGNWTEHTHGISTGDFMKTNQWDNGHINEDGSTTFYTYTTSPNPLACTVMQTYNVHVHDGGYGLKLFYESRGYTVTNCYNQLTDNSPYGGFTFANYKAQIDAGRPVMLNLAGHTVVGVGYDDSATPETIYIHDTWDYNTHSMLWGGSYEGMALESVSIVTLAAPPAEIDYGDAPDSPYCTTVANNGASHTMIAGPYLGTRAPDFESNGQPTSSADGDDTTGALDDEDGVTFGALTIGQSAAITFVVNGASVNGAYVDGWIDYDQDGLWEAGEKIVSGQFTNGTYTTGDNAPAVTISQDATGGTTYARFRINSYSELTPCGAIGEDGEVEDYQVQIESGSIESRPQADFDGDGDTDISVFRSSNGYWYAYGQTATWWGLSTDRPVPGDYDGDGDADKAFWRPSNGYWYVRQGASYTATWWGTTGDIPVPADYNGDGDTDLAIIRPSNGYWYVRDPSITQSGYYQSGDIPVPCDYDGDGDDDIAIFRPSNGYWYVLGQSATWWGTATDIPMPGDYDGDGVCEFTFWRPSNGYWYVRDGASYTATWWGVSTDIPVPGDYDGDGDTDYAVVRPANNTWYVRDPAITQGGYYAAGDFPLPARDTNGDGDPWQ